MIMENSLIRRNRASNPGYVGDAVISAGYTRIFSFGPTEAESDRDGELTVTLHDEK